MFLHILAMLAMDHNTRLGKRLELENSCWWIDESESVRENNFSESETVDSGMKIDQRVHTFGKMDTPDCCQETLSKFE